MQGLECASHCTCMLFCHPLDGAEWCQSLTVGQAVACLAEVEVADDFTAVPRTHNGAHTAVVTLHTLVHILAIVVGLNVGILQAT